MKLPKWIEKHEEGDEVVFAAKPYVFVRKPKGTKFSPEIENTLRWGIVQVTAAEEAASE